VSGERTPREEREARRAELSRLLSRALVDADASHAEVARACGVSETIVHEWCDPTKARALSVADARALPPAVRRVLAEYVVGAGAVIAERAVDVEGHVDLAHAAAVQRETGDVVREHLSALLDGRIDRAERRVLRREIAEAIRALAALDRGLELADEADALTH